MLKGSITNLLHESFNANFTTSPPLGPEDGGDIFCRNVG
jgi:hypothetical protein